jgi:hypothetical protein
MSTRLNRFFTFLLDNIFDFATMGVALGVALYYQIYPPSESDIPKIMTWILTVLGLMAVSGISERNRKLSRIQSIAQEGRDLILRRLAGKVHAKDFFLSEKSVSDKTFASADVIYVSGMTLTRRTRDYMYVWGQRLVAGATIKVMILEPGNSLLKELCLRSSGETTVDYWKNKIQTVQSLVSYIAQTPGNQGRIELGYLPYIPSYGFVIVEPDDPNGHCFVELYQHESAKPNPTFEVSRSDDPEWFQFFKEQFDTMWQSCRVESFANTSRQKEGG